jgi:osmoprotectant transport system substrate-binding protein
MDRRSFLAGLALVSAAGCMPRKRALTVGSKNFTEQLVLGELLAQLLVSACRQPVGRRFYLAGTYICHQALLAGRIDVYVEYTGTALAAILKEHPSGDSQSVYRQVKDQYLHKFGLDVMRGDEARRLKLTKLSQLASVAPDLRLGVGYEFIERQDGYKGLVSTYGLKFAEAPRVMDLGLLYRALQNKSVDVVAGNNTDGLIAALGFIVLEDDKHYFPPYDAVSIVRPQVFQECPQARAAFDRLGGRITAENMRKMNYAVDGEKKDAAEVVREFLHDQGLEVG